MGKKNDNVIDKPISEFLYTVIYATPVKKRQGLPEHLYRKINTEKRAKAFCERSTTDQKRELLSHLDIGFFWTFVAVKEFTSKDYIPILKDLKKGNNVGSIEKMCEKGVCVTNDLEYAFFLSQMAHNTTSKQYVREMERIRAGSLVRSWKSRFSVSDEDKELEKSALAVSKIIEKTLSYSHKLEGIVRIKEYEYRILNLLYSKRGEYIDLSFIWDYFAGEIPQRKLTISMNKLSKELYIQKHHSSRKFTISKSGIRAVNLLLDKIVQSLNF